MDGVFAAIVLIFGLILREVSRRCRDKRPRARLHAPDGLTDDGDCPVDLMTAERQRFKVKMTERIIYCGGKRHC